MDDKPRDTLTQLIADHGTSLCEDPRRCEALLRDLCGEHHREIYVLIAALDEGVAAELIASQSGVPAEVLLARMTRRLRDIADDFPRMGCSAEPLRGVAESGPPNRPKLS